MIFSPFTYALSFIPIFGGFVNALIYIVAALFTFIVASAVMATAYILYRPLHAIAVLTLIITFIVISYLSFDLNAIKIAMDAKNLAHPI